MSRELRANLIFLVCLTVFATPGFLLLMHRKLTGSPRPNDLPDPVPTSIAYIQPLPAPPLPRREPNLVRDWVRQLLQARQGTGVRVMRDGEGPDAGPLVSDRFITQMVGLSAGVDGSLAVSLLRWDERSNLATQQPTVSADIGDRTVQAIGVRLESIEVPRDVRHALQDVGYTVPPTRVWWIAATVTARPGDPAPRSITLRVRASADEKPETITLAPPPAALSSAATPSAATEPGR